MVRFEYERFKVQLKLALSRFSTLQIRHLNATAARRKEIADFLRAGQDERARILVKSLIRDDYLAEVYDLVHMLCDELLRSAMLISQEKYKQSCHFSSLSDIGRTCDSALEPAVKSVIYAAGRVDVPELLKIKEQLIAKYGKQMELLAMNGADPKLVFKLSVRNPDQVLVNRYLMAIAESYLIPWAPIEEEDPLVDVRSASPPAFQPELPPPPYSSFRSTCPVVPTSSRTAPNPPDASLSEAATPPTSTSPGRQEPPPFDELARRFEALKSNRQPKQ